MQGLAKLVQRLTRVKRGNAACFVATRKQIVPSGVTDRELEVFLRQFMADETNGVARSNLLFVTGHTASENVVDNIFQN